MRTKTLSLTRPMQTVLAAMLAIALILTLILPIFASSVGKTGSNIQPVLLQMAEENPDQTVRLIVQKADDSQMAEAVAARLGGQMVSDLSMIHAFAVEMAASQALKLSRSPYVTWVSLDAVVEEAGKPVSTETFTVADKFNEPTYYNNDGSAGWLTSWMEEDSETPLYSYEIGTPESGDVYISNGELYLSGSSDPSQQVSASRGVNLSNGVTSATLSFSLRFGPLINSAEMDLVYVELSSNGGQTYTAYLGQSGGNAGGNFSREWSFDITSWASEETRVRFLVKSGLNDPGEYVAFDNVQITYTGSPYPSNTFIETLRVDDVWAMGYDGSGVGVAIIDSGITKESDLKSNLVVQKSFNTNSTTINDVYGHGTHVAGIIGMDGSGSDGTYYGVAPGADLISLKVNDETGMAYESDVVAALQWVYDNKETYNIRVVNLSVNSTVQSSIHNSPLDAAVEILWFNGVVVVTSAGNYWDGSNFNPVLAAPANDPFVITVGATDEKGTSRTRDDSIANYSSFGTTSDGYFKPDIYAPGSKIVSALSGQSDWDVLAPDRVVGGKYFRLSGTSMAAPMVSGAIALLLQAEPDLTPDQIKYRLINSAEWIGPAKYLNVYNLVTSTTTASANLGLEASQLLWTGDEPVVWGSVAWNSVAWNSVAWNSVAWNSVAWNSVAWNSVAWNE